MSGLDFSSFFLAISAKRLSAVDAEPNKSNQHEFGGLVKAGFGKCLGNPGESTLRFAATFLYFDDSSEDPVVSAAEVSWYDSRRGNASRGPELRLYYQGNEVTDKISEGDLLVIAMRPNGELVLIFAPEDSAVANTLCFLFEVDPAGQQFETRFFQAGTELDLVRASIFQTLDIAPASIESTPDFEDLVCAKFGEEFPTTNELSAFARETLPDADPSAEPDKTLLQYMEREEALFRALEGISLESKLSEGFKDADDFLAVSLSVQNRRKSRAGHALEHHVSAILQSHELIFERGRQTEGKSKPDFIFPNIKSYHDLSFDSNKLTMLAAKTTCKDRWRQVLVEAKRIPGKHLVTLQPGISINQTDEMKEHQLQLVVPALLHETYQSSQRDWLLPLSGFIELVKDRQKTLG